MRSGWVRAVTYALATTLIVLAAYRAGVSHEERTYCGPGGLDDNDCMFGFIAGLEWAAVALLFAVALLGLLERLIRSRSDQDGG